MASSVAACRSLTLLFVVVAVSVTGAAAGSNKSTLNITNRCSYTVWPAILSGAAASSAAALDSTGFELAPGESRTMVVLSGWSGILWGRTLCSTDATTGKFTCVTGDCGSGKEDCAGGGPAGPATLAEFTLDGTGGGKDVYDVSLINGFNLPMLVAPQGVPPGGNGRCAPTGCAVDLNRACPAELRVKSEAAGVVACKNACQAFGSSQYCCTGENGNPDTCKPSPYSEFFKNACPRAVSYPYDDGAASVFTCHAADTIYAITLCPSATRTTSAKSSASSPNSQPPGNGNLPLINVTVPYAGSSQVGAAAGASPPWRIVLLVGVLSLLTAVLGVMAQMLGLVTHCFNQNQQAAGADGDQEGADGDQDQQEAAVADGDQETAVADGDQEGREIRPPPTDEAVHGGHKLDQTGFFFNGKKVATRSCPCSASSPCSCSSCSASSPCSCSSCRRRAQEPPPPSCLHHHSSSASAQR